MSTLVCVSSERVNRVAGKLSWFHEPGLQEVSSQPCFRLVSTLLEMSAAKQVQEKKHMFKSQAHFDYKFVLSELVLSVKEANFPELQFSCG